MAIHEIQIPILEDTYIDRNNPDTNYGNSTILRIGGKMPGAPYDLKFEYYALIKWDPSFPQVPPRKRILSQKLYIYNYDLENANKIFGKISTLRKENQPNFTEYTSNYNNTSFDAQGDFSDIDYGQTYGKNQYIRLHTDNASNGHMILLTTEGMNTGEYFRLASRESSNPPYWKVVYEDVPPDAPTPTTPPVGVYKDNTAIIRFEWEYNSSVGGEQKKFDLQWSSDNGSTWTTISQTTSNTYYDAPANTFPSGNITWRVRCYNEYDEVGSYCEPVVFYAIGKPDIVTITNVSAGTSRPTVEWSAFNQQIYQLQILQNDVVVYDTGNIPKINERRHNVKTFLPDGNYIAQVRIKNEYGLWSDWGQRTFTVSTIKPETVTFSIYNTLYGLLLSVYNKPAEIAYMLVYRAEKDSEDYICIAKLDYETVQYNDNTVKSGQQYKYFIRAVTENETYSDSAIKLGTATLNYSLLATVSDLNDVLVLKYTRSPSPDKQRNINLHGEVKRYVDRKLPVVEFSEFIENTFSAVFRLKDQDDLAKFEQIVHRKATVLYRDDKGRKMYGNILSYTPQDSVLGHIDISFTIIETDYSEEIEV